jgi:hypothetical protein
MSAADKAFQQRLTEVTRAAYTAELAYRKWGHELYSRQRWKDLRLALAEQDLESAQTEVNWLWAILRRLESENCPNLASQQAALRPLNQFLHAKYKTDITELEAECRALHSEHPWEEPIRSSPSLDKTE